MVTLLNSKGADKSAKDSVTIIMFRIFANIFIPQSGNLPEFYLDNEFPATEEEKHEIGNKDSVSNGPEKEDTTDKVDGTNDNANKEEENEVRYRDLFKNEGLRGIWERALIA